MESLKEKLDALNRKYASSVGSRVAEIEASIEAYIKSSSSTELELVYRKAHALAGTAKTFGLPDMSVTAKNLELAAKKMESVQEVDKILPLLNELKKMIPS